MSYPRFVTATFGLLLSMILFSEANAMYAPSIGRFMSRDPIGFIGSPYDHYEFVEGMPLVKRDPYGLESAGGVLGTVLSLIPPKPCGSASLTVNASAEGPVVDDSWLASDARILIEANKEIAKRLPWTKNASSTCPQGKKCCHLLKSSVKLTILFRVKYKATVPVIGNVTATVNIRALSQSKLQVGVCIKNNCPCPPSLPDVNVDQFIDQSDNVIDGNALEDFINRL